jgi:diguanylate cyclase (GGDEF)-like protein
LQGKTTRHRCFWSLRGEEFIILLPDTNEAGGLKAAERLRKQINNMEIESRKEPLSITVSMGVASLVPENNPMQSLDLLIMRADQALYAAISAGGNTVRTVSAPDARE